MWSFSNSGSSSQSSARDWDRGPKTPRRRSKSRSKGSSKGRDQPKGGKSAGKCGGKEAGYAAAESLQPWQPPSMLATLGIAAPDAPPPAAGSKANKDPNLDGILKGLKNHLRAHGQELPPEAEAFLTQKAGLSTMTIKAASQRLESSQKSITKLKTEILQQQAAWKKFQDSLSKEYDMQLEKHKEKVNSLAEALKKSEEEYSDAKKALQEAAEEPSPPNPPPAHVEELTLAKVEEEKKSPKRIREALPPTGEVDSLQKRLRQKEDVVDLVSETTEVEMPEAPSFG